MSWLRLSSFALALLLVAFEVRAAEPDDATRASARRLGDEAGELYEKGDYAAALDKYQRAASLVDVPTLGVRIARCLDKLGRLVEANERYVAVMRAKLPADALDVHKQALKDAASEQASLLPRIPTLVVGVSGPAEVSVTIDGKPISRALFGENTLVNPGRHRVVARLGSAEQTRDVDLKERESARVDFDFAAVPIAADAGKPSGEREKEPRADRGAGKDQGRTQKTLGIVSLAIGGAGLAVGTFAGLTAMAQKNDLEKSCGSDLECPPDVHNDANGYNRLRTVSTLGFVIGGVGVAAGVTLLLTAPRSNGARVGAFVGPSSAGVAGKF